jgi:REP element-mobilizing transposase RayT
MSRYIDRDILAELGELHYGRKRVQPASNVIREFYDRAKDLLQFPLLRFSDEEQAAIAQAFAQTISRERYTCYAGAIMPDHIHLVIRKHRDLAEQMILNFQVASRSAILQLGERDPQHPVWGGCGWKVFLDNPDDIQRTIRYVENNPIKARMPSQRWDFVTPYDGWPFHKR